MSFLSAAVSAAKGLRSRASILRAAPLIRRFGADRSANIAVLFGITLLPVLQAIGCAVDYSIISYQRTKVQSALDAAILAGSIAGKNALDSGLGSTAAIAAAKTAAEGFFTGTTTGLSATLNATFTVANNQISGSGTARSSVTNTFLGIMGMPKTDLTLSAQAVSQAQPYMNVYLLVDVSASMLLPTTDAGVQKMISGTGCAFACHDRADNKDSYGWSKNNGVELRYQVVNQGVQKLLDYLNGNAILKSHVKVGLRSFDDYLHSNAAMTATYSQISSNFPGPTLAVNEEAAATPFASYIDSFVSQVGAGGDGSSTASPQKLVIIASDGVNDPTRAWTWNTGLRPQVKVFDTAFCTTLKKANVKVAIINTPYLPMPWDWGYAATLGQPGSLGGATRVDDIPIALNACAGSLFTVASDVQTIQSSFTTLFQKASPIRLTN